MSIPAPVDNKAFYGGEEIHVLIKLVAEYTNKLKDECDKYDDHIQSRNNVTLYVIAGVAFYIAPVMSLIWLTFNPSHKLLSFHLFELFRTISIIVILVSTFVLIKLLGELWNVVYKFMRRRRSEIIVATNQLERLVRRTSPIAEYAGITLAEKLELDLRLADADAALEYAIPYTAKRSRDESGSGFEKRYEASL